MTNSIGSLLSSQITLPGSVESLGAIFRAAKPFPHVTIDNMLSDQLLDRLVQEMPSISEENWVHENNTQLQKYNLRSAVSLGEAGYQLTAFLHSASFLYFLSELTGIWQLLPDPYLQGSGYHLIPPGGKFAIHADRNTAYETGLTRRLSLIVYLNKDWPPEYGGQLELWNSDATRRERTIEPVFNRTVIFEIADGYYHGVPNPVACPPTRSRNSFVAYYHTVGADGRKGVAPHTSIYAPSFYRKGERPSVRLLKDLTPPIILRSLKRFRDGIK